MGLQFNKRRLFAPGFNSANDIVDLSGSGAPSNGTSGTGANEAGPGSTYTRTSNGQRYVNTNTKASPTWATVGTIAAGSLVNADFDAAAALARTKLAVNASQKYVLDVKAADGSHLVAAESAGTFNVSVVANVILLKGEVTDNETEVSVGYAQFMLPPEYVAATDLVLRLPVNVVKTAAAVDNGSTVDVEAYEQSEAAGTVGADLCATAAQTFAAVDTWYNKDFTITGAALLPGDVVNFKLTSSIIDSEAGGGTLRLSMAKPRLLISVQG